MLSFEGAIRHWHCQTPRILKPWKVSQPVSMLIRMCNASQHHAVLSPFASPDEVSIVLVVLQAQTQSSPDKETALFNWTKQWYPMAAIQDLDPAVPHPIKLLGTP